jgi:hypothetical protein
MDQRCVRVNPSPDQQTAVARSARRNNVQRRPGDADRQEKEHVSAHAGRTTYGFCAQHRGIPLAARKTRVRRARRSSRLGRTHAQDIGELLTLPRDWDSYGGRAVDPACAWAAWQLLLLLMREDSPVPNLVPTSRGGVQIEWHAKGIDLEIEVVTPQQFHISFEDAQTAEAWEKEMTDAARELPPWVARLSRPNQS